MKKIAFKNLVLGLVCLVVAILLTFIVILSGAVGSLTSEINGIKRKQKEIKKANNLIDNFDEAGTAKEEKELGTRIPEGLSFPLKAMKEFSQIIQKQTVAQIRLKAQEKSSESYFRLEGLKPLIFTANLVSGYEDLIAILENLPKAASLIGVENLQIKRNPKQLPLLEVSLTLSTFTIPGPEEKKEQDSLISKGAFGEMPPDMPAGMEN